MVRGEVNIDMPEKDANIIGGIQTETLHIHVTYNTFAGLLYMDLKKIIKRIIWLLRWK